MNSTPVWEAATRRLWGSHLGALVLCVTADLAVQGFHFTNPTCSLAAKAS